MRAGEYLVRLLTGYGVEVVFGIPGVHTLELYRALADSSLRVPTPRHEQGAGFMADGYARRSGKPGVCFIISGPGMSNIITAMGQAYGDSIPMLVVSTVNAQGRMGSGEGWLHELPDQRALVQSVCAFSHTVHHLSELPSVAARAFAVFDGSRPRPVHIELPTNVLAQAVTRPSPATFPRMSRPGLDPGSASRAASWLKSAGRPLILAGGGAVHAAASITRLA